MSGGGLFLVVIEVRRTGFEMNPTFYRTVRFISFLTIFISIVESGGSKHRLGVTQKTQKSVCVRVWAMWMT
jgi:hypothetical protein